MKLHPIALIPELLDLLKYVFKFIAHIIDSIKTAAEGKEKAKRREMFLGERVALYVFELADNIGIDLHKAMKNKLAKNARKYPVKKAKGKHTKYNKL
ncbi:hypothetical protein ES708_18040 [subsurface metagenome]